jgi:osmotically-inducible protein OsmY
MARQSALLFQFPPDRVDWSIRNVVPGPLPEGRKQVSQTKGMRDAVDKSARGRDDPTLTATANDALTLGRPMAVGVAAMAKNGHVTLTGAVRCGTERAAAEALIASLTGVRAVTDDIQIRDDAGPLYPGTELRERP